MYYNSHLYWLMRDPKYILVIIGLVLCFAASVYVTNTYSKYRFESIMSGMTGAEAAAKILAYNGIKDVQVYQSSQEGDLTDHYDPRANVIMLSPSVYKVSSVAAVAVAAHECGHVIQHRRGYIPIKIRSLLVPAANIGSRFGIYVILVGLLLGGALNYRNNLAFFDMSMGGIGSILVTVGVWAFGLAVAFQVITLPVELDASARAIQMLDAYSILTEDELGKGKKMLRAAAYTYVAAAASSILQFIRIILIAGGGKGSKRK